MADNQTQPATDDKVDSSDKKVHGVVAEFQDVDSLLAACRRVRDAGYTKADAFTPFPVHGIDKALGIKPTVLPWIAFFCGLSGTCIALSMQIGMNSDWFEGFSYPYIISGKPFVSLPAFIPVTFELTILLASFGTFFGMWALNGLPKFSNPMFTSPRFDRATDDTFFLFLDAKDERFDEEGAKTFLGDLGGEYIEPVVEDQTPTQIPKPLLLGLAAMICISLIPMLAVARMRVTKSSSPRFHIFPDMDFSPAKDAQQISTLFADGRAMRPDVPGTVIRGGLEWDVDFQTGIDVEKLAGIDPARAERLVALQSDVPTGDEQAAEPEAKKPEVADEKPAAKEEPPAEKAEPKEAEPEPKEAEPKEEVKEAKAEPKQPAEEKKPAAEEAAKPAKEEMKPPAEEPAAQEPASKSAEKDAENEKQESKPAVDEAKMEEPPAPEAKEEKDTTPWLQENPLTLTKAVLERGQLQFGIYCSVCHGMNGTGKGLVHERAQTILASTWTPPSNLHDPTLYADAYPPGKLFSTITNGIRKMPGYSGQINASDRWAIVAYVHALQASRNASPEDVPESQRDEILETQKKIQAALKAAEEKAAEEAAKAEAEAKAAKQS